MQATPGNSNLQAPPFVYITVIIQRTLYLYSGLQTFHIKTGESPAYASRMCALPKACSAPIVISSKCIGLKLVHIKLRDIKFAAPGISIFPDEEYFINRIGC